MRIRSLRPEFWAGKRVRQLSPWARLLLLGLNNYCDDEGRGEWDEVLIRSLIFPSNKVKIGLLLTELVRVGSIIKYAVNDTYYLAIPNWKDLQYIQKPRPSKYPNYDSSTIDLPESYNSSKSLLSVKGLVKGKDSIVMGSDYGNPPVPTYLVFDSCQAVRLTQTDYDWLLAKHTKIAIDEMILELEDYLLQHPKEVKTRNHKLTINNWLTRRIREAKALPTRLTVEQDAAAITERLEQRDKLKKAGKIL